jgi:hypothetical protein
MADGQAPGNELTYEDRIPLAWRALPEPATSADLAHLYEAALSRLNAILAVGEAAPADHLEDAGSRAQETARLEARVNLLVAMVGELLAVHRPPPAARSVRLGGQWVEWEEMAPPAPGEIVALDLYLSPTIPDPVRLPAEVKTVEESSGGGKRVRAVFPDLSMSMQNGLEKLIFRCHRRRIAEQRKAQAPR